MSRFATIFVCSFLLSLNGCADLARHLEPDGMNIGFGVQDVNTHDNHGGDHDEWRVNSVSVQFRWDFKK